MGVHIRENKIPITRGSKIFHFDKQRQQFLKFSPGSPTMDNCGFRTNSPWCNNITIVTKVINYAYRIGESLLSIAGASHWHLINWKFLLDTRGSFTFEQFLWTQCSNLAVYWTYSNTFQTSTAWLFTWIFGAQCPATDQNLSF